MEPTVLRQPHAKKITATRYHTNEECGHYSSYASAAERVVLSEREIELLGILECAHCARLNERETVYQTLVRLGIKDPPGFLEGLEASGWFITDADDARPSPSRLGA